MGPDRYCDNQESDQEWPEPVAIDIVDPVYAYQKEQINKAQQDQYWTRQVHGLLRWRWGSRNISQLWDSLYIPVGHGPLQLLCH